SSHVFFTKSHPVGQNPTRSHRGNNDEGAPASTTTSIADETKNGNGYTSPFSSFSFHPCRQQRSKAKNRMHENNNKNSSSMVAQPKTENKHVISSISLHESLVRPHLPRFKCCQIILPARLGPNLLVVFLLPTNQDNGRPRKSPAGRTRVWHVVAAQKSGLLTHSGPCWHGERRRRSGRGSR
ncbi:unnamed protein product, partial [Heterosigma akashiwo]